MPAAWCTIGTSDITTVAVIAGLSGVVAVLYIVIEDMIGRLTNPQHNNERAKSEIRSVLAGGVIVALLLSFLTTFGTGIGGFIDNYNTSTTNYLNNITNVINKASVVNAYMTDLAPYSYSQQESFIVKHGYTKSAVLAFLGELVGNVNNILDSLYNLWAIRKASIFFLCFAVGAAIKYIIPAGVILRFFPPTKRVGATFLSVGIGLVFFMPVAFYLSHAIIEAIMGVKDWNSMPNMVDLEDKIKEIMSRAVAPFNTLTNPALLLPYALLSMTGEALSLVFPGIGTLIHAIFVAVSKIALNAVIIANYLSINKNVDDIISYGSAGLKELADFSIKEFFKTLLFFVLIVFSTFVSIRSISILIGGEFFLYGIQERI